MDEYVKRLKTPQREVVQALRRLVTETAPDLREGINPVGEPDLDAEGGPSSG